MQINNFDLPPAHVHYIRSLAASVGRNVARCRAEPRTGGPTSFRRRAAMINHFGGGRNLRVRINEASAARVLLARRAPQRFYILYILYMRYLLGNTGSANQINCVVHGGGYVIFGSPSVYEPSTVQSIHTCSECASVRYVTQTGLHQYCLYLLAVRCTQRAAPKTAPQQRRRRLVVVALALTPINALCTSHAPILRIRCCWCCCSLSAFNKVINIYVSSN